MSGMIRFLRTQRKTDIFLLAVGLGCLVATAIQYPLSTTFPAGGDAATHIKIVQHFTSKPLATLQDISRSWYPVSYALFSVMSLVPRLSWPMAFSWWMALGQITSGISLGIFLYRLHGIRAAAIGIGLWAVSPIKLTSFFEDGTMAQLWSLPWILLFFERLTKGSFPGMIFFSLLAFFSHPITGLMLLGTLVITIPHLWIGKFAVSKKDIKMRKHLTISTLGLLIFSIGILATKWDIFLIPFTRESAKYISELFKGSAFPWTVASMFGAYTIFKKQKKYPILIIILGSFYFLSFLLAINDQIGIGFWTNRLSPYIVLCIFIGASIGFAEIAKNLGAPIAITIIASFLLVGISSSTFHDNQTIYKRLESPGTYSRIHPSELAAIEWIKENAPPHSYIFTSNKTRHYEWIPILSERDWQAVSQEQIANQKIPHNSNNKYYMLVIFTHKEEIPQNILQNPERYRLRYENPGAAIFDVKTI